MGFVHLHWKRDYFYHKPVQKDRTRNRTEKQQHHPEFVIAETTDIRQIRAIRGIQTDVTRLQ